jgi:hypothetical protein
MKTASQKEKNSLAFSAIAIYFLPLSPPGRGMG